MRRYGSIVLTTGKPSSLTRISLPPLLVSDVERLSIYTGTNRNLAADEAHFIKPPITVMIGYDNTPIGEKAPA